LAKIQTACEPDCKKVIERLKMRFEKTFIAIEGQFY
jgi:hypothetical protein